jgi:hypothetical protein
MDRNELKKEMLKKVAKKITEATNGTSYKKRVPEGVVDLSRERLKRRKIS